MSRNRLYFKLVMCIKHVITGYPKKHTHWASLHFVSINQMVDLNLSKASGGSLSMHFNKYLLRRRKSMDELYRLIALHLIFLHNFTIIVCIRVF